MINSCFCQKFNLQDSVINVGDYTYLYHISFTINKATLHSCKQLQLDSLTQWLIKNPDLVVEIGVHISNYKAKINKQKLTELRALNLKKHLIKSGIQEVRVNCVGLGNSKAICDCNVKEECTNKHDCGDTNRDASRITLVIKDKLPLNKLDKN